MSLVLIKNEGGLLLRIGRSRMFSFLKKIEDQIQKGDDEFIFIFSGYFEKIKIYLFLLTRINLFSFRLEKNSYFNISFFIFLQKYFWQKGYYFPEQQRVPVIPHGWT